MERFTGKFQTNPLVCLFKSNKESHLTVFKEKGHLKPDLPHRIATHHTYESLKFCSFAGKNKLWHRQKQAQKTDRGTETAVGTQTLEALLQKGKQSLE